MLIYDGELLNDKRNGKGKEFEDGILIYDGYFSKGKRRKFKGENYKRFEEFEKNYSYKINKEYNCLNGQLEYEGEFSKGKWNGLGKKYYKGKLDYVGDYQNGKRNGKGEEYDYNGILRFEGEYLNGKKWSGIGYDSQGVQEYEIKEGKGVAKEFDWLNGNLIYEGDYLDGERNGNGKEYNEKDMLIFEGEYLKGKKEDGIIKEYKYGNLICEGEYLNGKRKENGKIII